jgi:ABC-type amino acid transport substrate-binding protein
MAVCVTAVVAAPLLLAQEVPAPGGTLDRIRTEGRIRLGFRTDARPFAYKDETGQAAGYSVALCRLIADAAAAQVGLPGVSVELVPVTIEDRFAALQQGRVDLLCGAETVTLERRAQASFSIPIFPGGIGALMRADAPVRLREVISGRGQSFQPTWRASASQALQARGFTAVHNSTADTWLTVRARDLQVISGVSRVGSYEAGIQALLERRTDVFFGERAVLMDAAKRHPSARDMLVVDRLFTYEALALALRRGDEDFRLLVDRTLSRLYGSSEIGALYTTWFGEPDENALTFFRWNRLPD